ncbi:putative lyase [Piscirickettsia salmonis]|uniref:VOC family protein n=1 Tax=Piscirickettsia salmonis TaxID=1238 RepID=UPI0012B6EE6E|nr:VOC family protein [Piscirickettsia salmonis]QGP49495.1 putative lyase [Piscirickettsia salmonis]
MIKCQGLAHINIVVDDINTAISFYQETLGMELLRLYPNFKNIGFAKSAGFIEDAEKVNLDMAILKINTTSQPIFIELMQYHYPQSDDYRSIGNTNDIAGVRHIALTVENIEQAFRYLQTIPNVSMITDHPQYQPYQLSPIHPGNFLICNDSQKENNLAEKSKICDAVTHIKYFYFLDPYGVQWELEQAEAI